MIIVLTQSKSKTIFIHVTEFTIWKSIHWACKGPLKEQLSNNYLLHTYSWTNNFFPFLCIPALFIPTSCYLLKHFHVFRYTCYIHNIQKKFVTCLKHFWILLNSKSKLRRGEICLANFILPANGAMVSGAFTQQ